MNSHNERLARPARKPPLFICQTQIWYLFNKRLARLASLHNSKVMTDWWIFFLGFKGYFSLLSHIKTKVT